jgi:hypothetical protein
MDKAPESVALEPMLWVRRKDTRPGVPLSLADVSDLIPRERLIRLQPNCRYASVRCGILIVIASMTVGKAAYIEYKFYQLGMVGKVGITSSAWEA